MPRIQFYYAPGACSLAPHILLREAGLEFDTIAASVTMAPAVFPEGFSKINPKMRVPVITIDGETITEVPAIATAISNLASDMHLMGQTPLDTVRVYEWMNWLSGNLHAAVFGSFIRPQRFSDDAAVYDGIKEKALKSVKECFEFIEGRLVGVHAVGGALTAVDPYLFVFYRWGNTTGIEMKENYPKYTALVSNLVQQAAVKATLEFENIDSTL